MKRILAVAFLFAAMQTSAQQLMQLTNTRYAAAGDLRNVLRTSDRDLFLFWTTTDSIRVTKIADGYDRAGQALLASRSGNFDAVWTGTGFLFAGDRMTYSPMAHYTITGLRLDSSGKPVRAPFTILDNALLPRLASSRDVVVMVYSTQTEGARMIVLSHSGTVLGASTLLEEGTGQAAVASNGDGFVIANPLAHGIRIRLLDSTGQFLSEQFIPMAEGYRTVSVAAHGSQYLIATGAIEVHAMTLDEHGNLGPSLLVDDTDVLSSPRNVVAAWNGDGWTLAYPRWNATNTQLYAAFAHLTPAADRVVQEEQTIGREPTVVAFENGVRAAWRQTGGTTLARLPLSPATQRPVTFGARDQESVLSATSQKGTLVLWREDGWRAGLRTHAGDWSEHALGTILGNDMVLASDGRNFVLVTGFSDKVRVYFLDEDGRITREPLSFGDRYGSRGLAVTWGGTHYAIVSGGEVRLLSPSGELSAPAALEFQEYGPRWIASNGNGYLVALEAQQCPFILCYSTGLRGVRLSSTLERLDAAELVLADESADAAGVVWNGSEYVAAWQGENDAYLTSVPASGGTPTRRRIDVPIGAESGIVATSGGTLAILGDGAVHFVSNSGTVLRRDVMDRDDSVFAEAPRLNALPGGRAMFIAARARMEAPFHGARHVMFGVAGESGVVPPAPHASISLSNTRIVVTWSAPEGMVNGYRVEYRVDDGNWLEVERYYGPGELTASVARPAQGSEISIRVRAFNDAGPSSYSNVASMNKPRRRSTR